MRDHDNQDSRDDYSTRLTYLLIGGGLGALLALLFAPRSGQELRNEIADATRRRIERSREATLRLSDRAGQNYEFTRQRAIEEFVRARENVIRQSRHQSAEASAAGDETKGDYE
jgi:gas vesicle protein